MKERQLDTGGAPVVEANQIERIYLNNEEADSELWARDRNRHFKPAVIEVLRPVAEHVRVDVSSGLADKLAISFQISDHAAAQLARALARVRGEERVAQLLEEIASIDLDGVESNDDEHDIIAEIIERAREIVPASEECGECGAKVWTLVGCPDGAEICRNCFEQEGLH